MLRVLLIQNPHAGGVRGARRLAAARAALHAGGVSVAEAPCDDPGASERAARDAADTGRVDAVFVLGGDGTVRAVASGLRGSAIPLAVLPGGTTNVVAAALGVPDDIGNAVAALLAGELRAFDLGLCGDAPFLMQATAGLDARIMSRVDPRLKRRFGKGAVVLAAVREWARYRFPVIEIEVDGRRELATGVAVCNLSEYAGRFRMTPDGRPDDRQLELLVFRGRRRRDALGFALALAGGRHADRRDVAIRPVEEVNLLGPPDTPLQIDGDPWPARYPLRLRLAADRLQLLVPAPPRR
ncbi:MAG: NAD(+)/NADH kinase [Holophagales bacterium]|nr:MAG: NAD(+)/NADH kinase [Holophagales bacterium]